MTTGLITQNSEAYHAAAGISRSMLEWISPPKTPAHFKAKYIDKLIPDEETPALRLGSLTHRAILEPDSMDGAFHVKPEGMKFTTKEGIAWRDSHGDRPIIETDAWSTMKAMRESVWRHPLAKRLLTGAATEQSAFVEHDGQLLKARFDAVPKSGNALPDLKTIESADLDNVEKEIAKYGYYRQASHYLKVSELLGLGHQVFLFIFVEKNPPFEVAVYQLSDAVLDAGRMTIERDFRLLRNCMERDEWPGYGNEVMTAALPEWKMKRLERESIG